LGGAPGRADGSAPGRADAAAPGQADGTAASRANRSGAPTPLIALIAPTADRIAALRAAIGDTYRFAEYSTGEQAWAAMQFGSRFAAVICSQSLTGMDGAELVTRVRQSRDPALRHLPACLVADTIDEVVRQRARKATVQYLAAFDRSLTDVAPWLAEKLAPPDSRASSSRRSAALRQWAMGHRRLDDATRAGLTIVRLATEGIGDVAKVPKAAGVTDDSILAESYNTIWLSLDRPLALMPRAAMRLALGCIEAGASSAGSISIAYAPMVVLDQDTYDRLQTLAGATPPAAGHVQMVTHHWQARLPFELVRVLSL